jgi:O-antigen/teichoic acid export membrane protein
MHRLRPKTAPEAAGSASPLTGRSYWSFTWARAVTSVVQIILQRADIVLVSALLGPAEAAIYTVATRFLVVGQMISQSIGMAVEPQLAALLARGDLIGTAAVYRTSTSWQILVAWPFYLASAGLAAPLLGLFGEGYEAGSTVAAVLCLTMLVATALGSVSTVLNMAGRTTWTLANAVLSLGTNLVLLVLLLPRIGLIGAAISWAASILVQNLLPLAQLLLQYRLHPFGRVTSVAMLVTGACFGVPLVVMMLTDAPVYVRLLLVGSGVVAYLCACWMIRGPLELVSLAASLRRRPQPSRDAETTPTARPTTA